MLLPGRVAIWNPNQLLVKYSYCQKMPFLYQKVAKSGNTVPKKKMALHILLSNGHFGTFCKTPSSGFSKHFSSNLSAIADHVTLRDCTVIGSCGQRQNASPFWLVDPLNCAVHGVQYTSHLSLNNLIFFVWPGNKETRKILFNSAKNKMIEWFVRFWLFHGGWKKSLSLLRFLFWILQIKKMKILFVV